MQSEPHPLGDRLQRPRSGAVAELVGSVGSGAALILGLVYAVGALVKTAELRNAGVDVGTAFPLIPVQQHLSRGIEIFLAPGTLISIVAIFGVGAIVHRVHIPGVFNGVGISFDRGLRIAKPIGEPSEKVQDAPTVAPGGKDSAYGPLVLFILSAVMVIGVVSSVKTLVIDVGDIALGGAVLLLTYSTYRESDKKVWFWPTPALLIALTLVLATSSVVNAFATSADLSVATLRLTDDSTMKGNVAAVTDQAWYIAIPGGQLRVIDASRVASAVISKAKPAKNATLRKTPFELLLPSVYDKVNAGSAEVGRWLKSARNADRNWERRNPLINFVVLLGVIVGVVLAAGWPKRQGRKDD